MRIHFGVLLLIISLMSSCTKAVTNKNSIDGVWESLGSGWMLEIKDSTTYAIYDITAISCLPQHQGGLDEIIETLELKEDTLLLTTGVITYPFKRTNYLPELCSKKLAEAIVNDPLYNFEVFAETVKEHYAFMALNGIDWDELYEQQKKKLHSNATDAALYLTIEETLEKLNDNHAFLEATDAVDAAVEKLSSREEETIGDELPEYGDFPLADLVAKHHLQEDLTKDSWLLKWGKLTDDIGFIQVKSMWLFADLNLPKSLIEEVGYVDAYIETFNKMYEGDYIDQEVEGVRKIMDKVMSDLLTMNSIVIDVRFNGGGQDAVSFEILRRFIPENLQVAQQKLKYGKHYSPVLSLYIEGTKDAFTKPVYVLNSPQTGSAAEAFSIATMAMHHAKRVGSATTGAMSTALEKRLPNGWIFSISNEVYMDNMGKSYENIGVPVDYELNYPRDRQTFFRSIANDLDTDRQNILTAIEELKVTPYDGVIKNQ